MPERTLIVNADDFGRSPGINAGIIQAHEHGIVTSASLMVRWPAALEAADYGRLHSRFSLGLHVDLCEWVFRQGDWVPLYEVVSLESPEAVASEIARQLDHFRTLVGADPTHLDSHQHVHRYEPVRSFLAQLAERLGVPLRGCAPAVQHCGAFYGQGPKGEAYPEVIRVSNLLEILAGLPPGMTELACHPGLGEDLDSMYVRERAQEVAALCDPAVVGAVSELGIALRSFRDLRQLP